jgi:hypothetical protein
MFPTLPALLADIRRRPGVHLGETSILALEHQFLGIQFAEDFHQIPLESRLGGFDLGAFERWVDQTLNTQRLSARSSYLARHIAGSDAAGFDLWFEWYDLFCNEHAAGESSANQPVAPDRGGVTRYPEPRRGA